MDFLTLDLGDDIPGESTLEGFTGKIDLLSFSHGISLPMQFDPSSNGRTIGRSQHGDLSVSKQVDQSSPKLNLWCCQGKNIATATLTASRVDGDAILPIHIITLTNAIVSSVSVSGGSGSAPTENVTFNYTKIAWKYTAQKDENAQETQLETIWDLTTSKSG